MMMLFALLNVISMISATTQMATGDAGSLDLALPERRQLTTGNTACPAGWDQVGTLTTQNDVPGSALGHSQQATIEDCEAQCLSNPSCNSFMYGGGSASDTLCEIAEETKGTNNWGNYFRFCTKTKFTLLAHSEGCDAPDKTCGGCGCGWIQVNGVTVDSISHPHGFRGWVLAAVDANGEVLKTAEFNYAYAKEQLVPWVMSLEDEMYVVLAMNDDVNQQGDAFSEEFTAMLNSLGLPSMIEVGWSEDEIREQYAAVGYTGCGRPCSNPHVGYVAHLRYDEVAVYEIEVSPYLEVCVPEEESTMDENNFYDGVAGGVDQTLDPTETYVQILSNGYTAWLSGWTHTREYANGVLTNQDNTNPQAVISGLSPNHEYSYSIYQYGSGYTNGFTPPGGEEIMTTVNTNGEPTASGTFTSDVNGEALFSFRRTSHHIHLSAISIWDTCVQAYTTCGEVWDAGEPSGLYNLEGIVHYCDHDSSNDVLWSIVGFQKDDADLQSLADFQTFCSDNGVPRAGENIALSDDNTIWAAHKNWKSEMDVVFECCTANIALPWVMTGTDSDASNSWTALDGTSFSYLRGPYNNGESSKGDQCHNNQPLCGAWCCDGWNDNSAPDNEDFGFSNLQTYTWMMCSFADEYSEILDEPTSVPSSSPSTPPTVEPSASPSAIPTAAPSAHPSIKPSNAPTVPPTTLPSIAPSTSPTGEPSANPSAIPTAAPSLQPTAKPSNAPTNEPTSVPSISPSTSPSEMPSASPSAIPTTTPSVHPSVKPSNAPTTLPSIVPSKPPTGEPSVCPSAIPTAAPSVHPSVKPSNAPSISPTSLPSMAPSTSPTREPSASPSAIPIAAPSVQPTLKPSKAPTSRPSTSPTNTTPTTTPTDAPSSSEPTVGPTAAPSVQPTATPTNAPTRIPTRNPTIQPVTTSMSPASRPTVGPTIAPSINPTAVANEKVVGLDDNMFGMHRNIVLGIFVVLWLCCCISCFMCGSRSVKEVKEEELEVGDVEISRWPTLKEIEGYYSAESPIETPVLTKWGSTDVVGEVTE